MSIFKKEKTVDDKHNEIVEFLEKVQKERTTGGDLIMLDILNHTIDFDKDILEPILVGSVNDVLPVIRIILSSVSLSLPKQQFKHWLYPFMLLVADAWDSYDMVHEYAKQMDEEGL